MTESSKLKTSVATYLIVAWMVINAIFMILEVTVLGDAVDLNNSIELILWFSSLVGLLSMRKWGIALTVFTLCYTLSTSMGIIIYFSGWVVNAPRVILNAIATWYIFKSIFAGKFK
jgi:hypothetical protein